MANKHDISRDQWMLKGPLSKKGYDWWWHSFTGISTVTGEKKPMFIEFYTCNPALAQEEPVIVWNDPEKQRSGVRPSYVMVKAGCWGSGHMQLHRFFPWREVRVDSGVPFRISAGDCSLSEDRTCGSVTVTAGECAAHPERMSDAGSFSWDLSIKKEVAFHVGYGAGSFFRRINAFEMFWHAEGMKTAYSGTVTVNGEVFRVLPESCNGYADKNWGGDFTSPWVWLSSNDLTSRVTGKKLENSVFDIGGGRPKIYFLALNRKLLGEFFYEGKDYEFNFSKFWTFSGTKFTCEETEDAILWHVVQTTLRSRLETDITCLKKDMLLVNYEAPTGLKRHNRLWNGGNGRGTLKLYRRSLGGKLTLIDEVAAEGVGCEYGEYC